QEGIAYYKKALAIDPDSPRSLANLGVALILSGELQEASNTCRKAISLRPDYIPAHWSLSFSLLSSGDYENGWKEYEWRFRVEDTLHAHLPQLKKWNGSSHCSRDSLVLVSEQGFGDIMQFMRYILYLRKRGMIVAFCTRTKLHGFIQSSGITSEIYSPEEVHQLTTREWLPLLSLPMHLKIRPDNPLIQEPYIKAPAERILYWKQKLSSENRPIIGINWQGNASTEIHMLRGRSLPLETFTPLTENIDASFLSLQKGDGSEQLTDCKFLDRFVDCQEEINQTWDFVENAAIIMNCDLIITMDTSVAHLAGGLGKTTWLLLHKPCDWRWGMEGDTTFWYPSMHLFRQRERGNWQEVMDRVAMALQGAYS
ncbi:MAG: tetratricopeptide repeat protein, partial [Synechococcus sp. SB0665_bin_28]|nr:tetratricopeptide repeat protein [Synechococcus sp. SB0665_bin_28]